MSKWETIATEETGSAGTPGGRYCVTKFHLSRRGNRWRVAVESDWGSNQGYLQSEGTEDTEGRGDSPEEACEAVREDIFAWQRTHAEYSTALRKLCYTAEDVAD